MLNARDGFRWLCVHNLWKALSAEDCVAFAIHWPATPPLQTGKLCKKDAGDNLGHLGPIL